MLNPPFVSGSYYHIYNRGVEKRRIFLEERDFLRFLETLDFYRKFPTAVKLSDFRRGYTGIKKIENQKEIIKILCYCLMPNHFHLLIQQLEDGGITEFMRRLSDSYTRFFNTKYKRIGSLFQGGFKAKIIETDEYLLQLSKYIHRNPFPRTPLPKWEAQTYPYSSYDYYLNEEKHPFCDTEFIGGYFSKTNPKNSYKSFVEENEYDDPVGIYNLSIDSDECAE